jgi:hypothetical protein
MRLTLRTLLAYLDDILDPADKEQLAKKIESSEFAEDLVHRTRDTMRRLRLSAPQVIGNGMGLDPNTVAEYLDNVLPPESVGDFERICLESDMHLAEAAACHHVLTMVLGEPADIDPLARQRMYSVPTRIGSNKQVRVEAAHVPVNVPLTAAPPPAEPVQVVALPTGVVTQLESSQIMEIPDYLRTSRWSAYRVLAAGLAAVLLVGSGLYFFTELKDWFGGRPVELAQRPEPSAAPAQPGAMTPTEQPNAASESVAGPTIEPGSPATPATNGAEGSENTAAVDDMDVGQAIGTEVSTTAPGPQPPVLDSSSAPGSLAAAGTGDKYAPVTESAVQTESPDGDTTNPPPPQPINESSAPTISEAPAADPTDLPAVENASTTAALPTAATGTTDIAAEPGGTLADATVPSAANATELASAVPAPSEESGKEAAPVDVVPEGPAELGTYLGGNTVLLRYDDEKGVWFRVAPRQAVVAGERLLALPEFRPKIILASGVNVDVSGSTQVIMNVAGAQLIQGDPDAARSGDGAADETFSATEAHVPLVEVVYGRVILFNTASEENVVRMKVGAAMGDARLAPNATLAVEVERQYVPGRDPQQSPAPVIGRVFAPDGGVQWRDATGERLADNAARWTITEGTTSELVADPSPPEWIDEEPAGPLAEQRFGAPVVDNTLRTDTSADIQLLELFHDERNRKEVKSLVARSSIHLGLFEPFIEALRDSEQKANWRSHIETLRSAMALSPESATKVKQALNDQRGTPAADELYEMLCGYSEEQVGRTPEQVKSGAVPRLIDWLEEDSLDYRVLAVHNLLEITGKRIMDNPAAGRNERSRNIKVWRARLAADALVPEKPR